MQKVFQKENIAKKREIVYLQQNIPKTLKSVYALCLKKAETPSYTFVEKFEHDRWKKVQDHDDAFELLLANSKFDENADSKTIETELRDVMRSAKEIPALKDIGFAWIVTLPKSINIEDILGLYFLDNHIFVQKGRKISYIACSKQLSNISMREFVNRP